MGKKVQYLGQFKRFEISQIGKINFGDLDGENDSKLADSFFPTQSIRKLFGMKYNYILSPKGGGKSALFRAMLNTYVPNSLFSSEQFSIININSAFNFESEYLPATKFKDDVSENHYTLAWALFLLSELIRDIKKHSDKIGYPEIIKKLRKVDGFKEQYNLYDFSDSVKTISFTMSFKVNGQDIEVKPAIKIPDNVDKLVLNQLFVDINEFYKANNITALIIIDRIDNFVRKEKAVIQKKYLQGLINCVEEIFSLGNVFPMLFIRTDLFYSNELDYEYDKLKGRTLKLDWEDGETLNFIVRRLLSNRYIKENYLEYLSHLSQERREGEHDIYKNNILPFYKRIINFFSRKRNEIDLKRSIDYTVAEKFLLLFLPEKIERFQDSNLCLGLFQFLQDANGFVNPRLLIHFFNLLFETQHDFNLKFNSDASQEKAITFKDGQYHFDLFSQDIIPDVYKIIQNDELINIYKILKEKELQNLFIEINKKTSINKTFKSGDFKLKNYGIDKDQFDSLLKYLGLLGFCKNVEQQTYEIPHLFHCEMSLGEIK